MRVRFGHPVGGGVPPLALAAFAVIIRGIKSWQMCKATRAGRQELQRTVNARVWSTCVSTWQNAEGLVVRIRLVLL